MKYFFDTEFLEGKQPKKLLGLTYGYTKPTIDLISIGIVAEDSREYFALSNEFNLNWAWEKSDGLDKDGRPIYWIRDNVLLPIYKKYVSGDARNRYDFSKGTMRYLMDNYGKSNADIALDIEYFVKFCPNDTDSDYLCSLCRNKGGCTNKPRFYAYFADYDWVVFCWLFGRMLDLPKNFPYYCRDLKQMLDEKVDKSLIYVAENGTIGISDGMPDYNYCRDLKQMLDEKVDKSLIYAAENGTIGISDGMPDYRLGREATFSEKLTWIKKQKGYPQNSNEHCALADAKWNKELYKFIQDFK